VADHSHGEKNGNDVGTKSHAVLRHVTRNEEVERYCWINSIYLSVISNITKELLEGLECSALSLQKNKKRNDLHIDFKYYMEALQMNHCFFMYWMIRNKIILSLNIGSVITSACIINK
jgi:hypothetical protein